MAETGEGETTTLTAAIEPRSDMTLYTRWGDWWPQLCLGIAVLMIAGAYSGRVQPSSRESVEISRNGTVPADTRKERTI